LRLEVRRKWQVMMQSGGGGSAATEMKQEPTEQHVGGGGGGFGSILDFPRHRVVHGGAVAITTNQMRGLHDRINLTGKGDGDGAPAPLLLRAARRPRRPPAGYMAGARQRCVSRVCICIYCCC
jgi:hypothetical protein